MRNTLVALCLCALLSGNALSQTLVDSSGQPVASGAGLQWAAGVAPAPASPDFSALTKFGTLENFTYCAAADVVSTAVGIQSGLIHEINPLTNAVAKPFLAALGYTGATVLAVTGLSIAGYFLLKWLDKPAVTGAAAALACFSGIRNDYLMLRRP